MRIQAYNCSYVSPGIRDCEAMKRLLAATYNVTANPGLLRNSRNSNCSLERAWL